MNVMQLASRPKALGYILGGEAGRKERKGGREGGREGGRREQVDLTLGNRLVQRKKVNKRRHFSIKIVSIKRMSNTRNRPPYSFPSFLCPTLHEPTLPRVP